MTGEIEGLGELVTGGLAARAIEGANPAPDRTALPHCLNCGTARIGDFCHVCGQSGHIHRSLAAFWHDLLHGVLHFEGKTWRTLPMLFFRPGELTRRYVEGERARFISPLAMFLFTVFLMFAVIQALGYSASNAEIATGASGAEAVEVAGDLIRKDIGEKHAERDRLVQQGKPTAAIDREIAASEQDLRELTDAASRMRIQGPKFTSDMATGWKWFDEKIGSGIKKANENPGLALYKLQANGYKFSWMLIPISVPFVWLLFFWKRQYRVYDHVVFVTYSISFMSLLAIGLTLLAQFIPPEPVIPLAGTFIPPLHMYRQLRGAYRLRRRTAIVRTFLLLFLSVVALVLFFFLLILLGFLG